MSGWAANKAVAGLLLAVLLAGCGPSPLWDQPAVGRHVVRSGETLYTIAWRYGRDYRDLARWNRLGDGSLIYPGQVILLNPPAAAGGASSPSRPAATKPAPRPQPPPPWEWPTRGPVIAEFTGGSGSGTGLVIGGRAGQAVRAAAAGRVVYSGGGLIGYGQLIILKHNDTYLSAYGHNASLLVAEGDNIKKGQRIATMGEGPGQEPRLHFEIRRNGKPVNPRQYLPAR
ncbi:MAG: peptidoglycan DD-metalloendopeptidase family protein [Woeseiaceae bacterium]|nr:peptidoglycan DD-metalloendopeptidase family protein [Woeseiaceae bacterium]